MTTHRVKVVLHTEGGMSLTLEATNQWGISTWAEHLRKHRILRSEVIVTADPPRPEPVEETFQVGVERRIRLVGSRRSTLERRTRYEPLAWTGSRRLTVRRAVDYVHRKSTRGRRKGDQ